MIYTLKDEEPIVTLKVTMPEPLYRLLQKRAAECQRKITQQVRFLVHEDLKQAKNNPAAVATK